MTYTVKTFKTLWIWQEAHSLRLEIHSLANSWPHIEVDEKNQIRRSSGSVPDNIAEGYSSYYLKDKQKGLFIAIKEARETQSHLQTMSDKGYISKEKNEELQHRYDRLIAGINNFLKDLNRKNSP